MEKRCHNDIAAFPELFGEIESFADELSSILLIGLAGFGGLLALGLLLAGTR